MNSRRRPPPGTAIRLAGFAGFATPATLAGFGVLIALAGPASGQALADPPADPPAVVAETAPLAASTAALARLGARVRDLAARTGDGTGAADLTGHRLPLAACTGVLGAPLCAAMTGTLFEAPDGLDRLDRLGGPARPGPARP